MIPLRDQEYLRQRFARDLTSRVRIDYFTQRHTSIVVPGREECVYCEDVQAALEEIDALSERIALSVHELSEARELAGQLGVGRVPAIVIRGQTNRALRFFGAPLANQFPGLIETLIDAARGTVDLQPESVKQLKRLKSDVRLQVFVEPTCAYCPAYARSVFRLALHTSRVKVDVIEATEFPVLVHRYGIRAVPTTVFDEKLAMPGAMDEPTLVREVLRHAAGRPLEPGMRTGPATAFALPSPEQQQRQPAGQTTASGLIIPR